MPKKSTKRAPKKSIPTGPTKKTLFLRQVWAFLLIVIALLVLIGGFDWGGKLPVAMYDGLSWLFGYATFVLPLCLVVVAISKFRHEEYRTSLVKTLSSISLLTFVGTCLHIFVDREDAKQSASDGKYGGMLGHLLSSGLLQFLNSVTTFVVALLLALASAMVLFGVTPANLWHFLSGLFSRDEEEYEEDEPIPGTGKVAIKINGGVPLDIDEPDKKEHKPRLTLRNTAKPLTAKETHQPLVANKKGDWNYPTIELLDKSQDKADAGDVQKNARTIADTFMHFNIPVEMEGANIGPRVTQFTLKPPTGVKLTKITALESNIALDLSAQSIRIEAPIPGRNVVGIEVPNIKSATVRVSSILASKDWKELKSPLGFVIGKDIAGQPVVGALEKMPHLLIAGQTGSGKSVMINALLTSLLYRNSPHELKLILVDPKQVELAPYNDIPHLLTPVIVEPEKCISALKWAVAEMERRLKRFAEVGKRNIAEYNLSMPEESMPFIVVVIDELADLMMMAARDVEALIVRLAQKARAAGIHLVLATQRPSVDVITGLIKANVPARISFTVASQVDSRTIIDQMGAEKLLGMGDLLFLTSSMPKPIRAQGAFIHDNETEKVTNFLRSQQPPQYDDEVVSMPVQLNGKGGVIIGGGDNDGKVDEMWDDAVRVVVESRKASTSLLQTKLRLGYGRAARIIAHMEDVGIVGQSVGSKSREVLITDAEAFLNGSAEE